MVLQIKKYLFRQLPGNKFTSPIHIYYKLNEQKQKQYLTVNTFFNANDAYGLLASTDESLYKYISYIDPTSNIFAEEQPVIVARTLSNIVRVPLVIVTNYYSNINTKDNVFEVVYFYQDDLPSNVFKQFLSE